MAKYLPLLKFLLAEKIDNSYVKDSFHILNFLVYLFLKLNCVCDVSTIITFPTVKQSLHLSYQKFNESFPLLLQFEIFHKTMKELNK